MKKLVLAFAAIAVLAIVPAVAGANTGSKYGCTIHVANPTYRYVTVNGALQTLDIHVKSTLRCESTRKLGFYSVYLFRDKDFGVDTPIGAGGSKGEFTARAGHTYHATARKTCSVTNASYHGDASVNIPGNHSFAKKVVSKHIDMYCSTPGHFPAGGAGTAPVSLGGASGNGG